MKNFKKANDIDMVFIIPSKNLEKQILAGTKSAERISTKKIHELIFTESEFKQMLKEKGNNVGKEIIKNNIILYGSESYINILIDIYE